jgi:nitrogen regulatory protein P-II 1
VTVELAETLHAPTGTLRGVVPPRSEATSVKKVEAVIDASSLSAVTAALDRLDVGGITVSEVAGCGYESAGRVSYRGASYAVDSFPKLVVEVVAADAYAGPIAWAIATAARAGPTGDGVVSVQTVEEALHIRTGGRGLAAMGTDADERPAVAGGRMDEVAPRGRRVGSGRPGLPASTRIILTNVVLATAFVVFVFHAPIAYAGLGSAIAGLALWARERRAQARRTR